MRVQDGTSTEALSSRLLAGPRFLRARIEQNIADHGLIYPWWIPLISATGQISAVVVALGLRDALWPVEPITLSLVLVVAPAVLLFLLGRHMPPLAETLAALIAAGWLLSEHVHGTQPFDIAPALLAVVTAEVVARDGIRSGLAVAGISTAMITTAALGPGLPGTPIHIVDVLFGFVIGYTLLWQMRALAAERAARESESVRATLAERSRIAREIHDLVAHSLSVTLLQITGARRALLDLEDADVSEVDDALADAERVGRQAMADIRQTVSTLADGPSDVAPLPGAADIADLVAQMERAGLAVEFSQDGDPERLAQATGLGLYRIAQESLANIAKHAPASTARVELTVSSRQAHLVVRNALPAGTTTDGCGSGLVGMSERAEQLGATLAATRVDDDWLVELTVPLRERNGLLSCPLRMPTTAPAIEPRAAW